MRIAGWSFGKSEARLAVLPAIAIAGCAIWLMLPQTSDAEGHSTATPSEVTRVTRDASRTDDTAGTQATLSSPAPTDANAPPDIGRPTSRRPQRLSPPSRRSRG